MVSRNVKLIFRKMQEDTVEVEWRTKLVFTLSREIGVKNTLLLPLSRSEMSKEFLSFFEN